MGRNTAKRRKSKHHVERPLWEPSRRTSIVLLLCVIALFAAIRFRLRDMPLERDEGEYAYAGQLILQGIPPYKLAYNMKLPGVYAAYAVLMAALGQTPAGIHIGLLLVNSVTIVLIYVLARQLFGRFTGLVAALSYGALSTSPTILGLQAHATHFVVLAAVAGLVVLLQESEQKRSWLFLLSGILFGIAFMMKQPGIFFGLFAVLYVAKSSWTGMERRRAIFRTLLLIAGIALPYVLTCAVLWQAGVFGKFWFWTVSYAREYGRIITFKTGMDTFLTTFPVVVDPSLFIWLIAAGGFIFSWWYADARPHRFLLSGLLAFSFVAICPGLYFRRHYFILMLPAVSLLAGVGVRAATDALRKWTNSRLLTAIPAVAFLVAFGTSVFSQQKILFQLDPVTASLEIYGPGQPFEQAVVIANYIRTHSDPSARIAVLGSEPEIYFYAHRHSATGYIYTYPLMESQRFSLPMQKEMIAEIENTRPQFIAFVKFPLSWLRSAESEDYALSRMSEYLSREYEVVGTAELESPDRTQYRWDQEARSSETDSPYVVFLFRRHA
jgi:hypothetical protein